MKNILWVGLTLSLLGLVSVAPASADERDKKTILTFSQPFEIPGHVLPAGTYTFKVLDSLSDRHIVQVFDADGSKIIATVMAIPDYRLKGTDKTVIKFTEVPAGSPEAIRAWFYPGNTIGQEFVYPKRRALQLAKAGHIVVPAITDDVSDVDAMKTASIVAVTEEEKEMPVAAVIQTTPMDTQANTAMASARSTRELPHTASSWPLVLMLGLGALGAGISLMAFGKYSTVAP